MSFDTFQVEGNDECSADYLEVREKNATGNKTIYLHDLYLKGPSTISFFLSSSALSFPVEIDTFYKLNQALLLTILQAQCWVDSVVVTTLPTLTPQITKCMFSSILTTRTHYLDSR